MLFRSILFFITHDTIELNNAIIFLIALLSNIIHFIIFIRKYGATKLLNLTHMKVGGVIHKMRTSLGNPVSYTLGFGDEYIEMNPLIGKEINLSFGGDIFCISCGKKTKKSFAQGFCYPCFMSAPEAAECIIRPELCRAHEGEGRDIEWEKANHLQEHFVYLAVSKIGRASCRERV